MEWVTQTDMDALAKLANDKLLPIVNDPANSDWANYRLPYDKYTSDDWVSGAWVSPQPEYKFENSNFLTEFNRIFSDAMEVFDLEWELAGSENLRWNPAAVCSGPWVVGVNDPDTWLPGPYKMNWPGILQGSGAVGGEAFVMFNGVKFWSKTPPAYIDSCRYLNSFYARPVGETQVTCLMPYTIGNLGFWKCRIEIKFHGPPVAPEVSDFTFTDNSDVAIAWTIEPGSSAGNFLLVGTINEEITVAGQLEFTIQHPVGYEFDFPNISDYQHIEFTFVSRLVFSTATSSVAADCISTDGIAFKVECADIPANSSFVLDNQSHRACWILSDPAIRGVWSAKTLPCPGLNVYIDQDMPPYIGRTRNENNFIGALIDVGVAGNGETRGSAESPLASTMRQAAPFEIAGNPDGSDKDLIDGVQSVQPGISCRPAKWLVRRDTDFVPFELGFNTGLSGYVAYSEVAYAKDSPLVYHNISVPPNATRVKIRLLKPGAIAGWKNGKFQYGEPLDSNLTIFVKQNGYPSPTDFDFKTENNQVNITGEPGSDGGQGYLALIANSGFDYAIQNTGQTDVAFDVYVEIDYGVPTRVYFPPIGECFSYCLDGTPGIFKKIYPLMIDDRLGSKPIPQSGYCIFKLRATRLPIDNGSGIAITPASGAALTITIGQNLNAVHQTDAVTFAPLKDATGLANLTITIPANARDSGDVAVFIPVLAGNELVFSDFQLPPQALYVVGKPKGLLVPGNIDLNHRPIVVNSDGSISTIRSISIEEGGNEVLIPTVSPQGTILSNPAAIDLYLSTGQHLGKFGNVEDAESYAVVAHNYEAQIYAHVVILEAWANWQPIFFNRMFGTGQFPYDPQYLVNTPMPTFFRYCLSFANLFNIGHAGYAQEVSAVQFPLFRSLYDDLMTLLGLI